MFNGQETFGPGTWAKKLYTKGYTYDRDPMNSPVHPSGKPPASAYAPPCPTDVPGGKGAPLVLTMNGKYYRNEKSGWSDIVEAVLRDEFSGWSWS